MKAAMFYAWGATGVSRQVFDDAVAALGIDTVVIAGNLLNGGLRESVENCVNRAIAPSRGATADPADLDIILQPSPLCATEKAWTEPSGVDRLAAEKELANLLVEHQNIRGVIISHEDGIRAVAAPAYLPQFAAFCTSNKVEPILLLSSPAYEDAKVPFLKGLAKTCSVWAEVNTWHGVDIPTHFPSRAGEIAQLRKPLGKLDAVLWQIAGDRIPTKADGVRRQSAHSGVCEVEFVDGTVHRVNESAGASLARQRLHGREMIVSETGFSIRSVPREQVTPEQFKTATEALADWKGRCVLWVFTGGAKWMQLSESPELCVSIKRWWA